MPTWLFVIQALLIGATIFAVMPHHVLLRLQVVVWTIGVVSIAVLVGVDAQDRFYSNDQVLHVLLVQTLRDWSWLAETSVVDMRLPYALPAVAISSLGFSEILALKSVSLICLLILSHQLLTRFQSNRPADQLKTLYMTGCGLIGSFFSLLALRETMMMLFAYLFFSRKSPSVRALSITMLFLLRPHLAAALLIGEIVSTTTTRLNTRHSLRSFLTPLSCIISVVFGKAVVSLNRGGLLGEQSMFLKSFGLDEIRQIASNFVGLQFLTTGAWNVNFSIGSLVFLRGVLSETILIPALFTVVVLLSGPLISRQHLSVLIAFSLYVSIATSTEFNSFRQNIPLMPLLGAVILDVFAKRRQLKVSSLFSRRFGSTASPIGPRET
jgi:hypothetical protein